MAALDTALTILSKFSRSRTELGVGEIADELGLPRSSVSRLMASCERAGFLERTQARRYRPGPELHRTGALYSVGVDPIDRIDAELRLCLRRYPASGYICINRGMEAVILRMREGTSAIRFVVPEGSIVPAFTVAIGKAVLSRLGDDALEALLPERALCDDPFYDMSKAQLLEELQEGRQRRWLSLRDMAGRGVDAMAIAIRPHGADTIGVALSFMATVAPELKAEMRESLIAVGTNLGVALGDDFWRNGEGGS